jgi:putative heme-binding domain-containing protein
VGYHRSGPHAVFEYQIDQARVLDRLWSSGGSLMRSIEIQGKLPGDSVLNLLRLDELAGGNRNGASVRITGRQHNMPVEVSVQHVPEGVSVNSDKGLLALQFSGDNSNTIVHLAFSRPAADGREAPAETAPSELLQVRMAQWSDKTVITKGQRGADEGAFAIDTLTIPYADQNPFGMPMRLTGVGIMPDGRIAVATLQGDVWLVSGVDEQLDSLTWRRFASGLYQPLGLVIQDGKVLVGGKDQVTRLHDLNDDGEADFYECVTNDYPSTGGHDFATDLHQDDSGRLYWATASGDFGLTRYQHGGKPESLGNGLRNSNGIGVSADGSVTLAAIQEGSWCPATAIFEVKNGSFHGHGGPREGHGKYGYDLPLCFVPRGVDNSAGGINFLPQDDRLGPLSGQILGTSYGYCNAYTILRESVNGKVQGGIVPLPVEFISGACRTAFDAASGSIYVAGTEGWQSYAAENGCLQRLRFTGQQLLQPEAIETRENGLLVHLNAAVDPSSVNVNNIFCQQWNYLFSGAYGSPEYSVKQPGRQGHDYVPVRSVHLLEDGRSIFIEIPELHPVMQFHLHMQLRTAEGVVASPDVYYSIYEMDSAFTDFPGYQLIAKRPWANFPIAEKYEQDPRLVEQDSLGTNFGWVSSAKKLTLNAAAGLQYKPRRLRIEPGARVALTFHNTDPSMPHNVVVVKADQVQSFGEQSMVLATNPRAIATHYVPDDPAEICFSPILNPGDQYTVYFEAPQQEGEYRFLCTYPGHWRVMQGSLFVLPADKPLPEPTESELTRRFVKNWAMQDFAGSYSQLDKRSAKAGQQVFRLAGCIKCHKVGNEGIDFGPKLAESTKKFRGEALLKQILEPSAEINKDFQTWLVVKTDGTVATGLLKSESPDSVQLLPNPLKPDETVTVARSEIEEMQPSRQSTMPNGLLMTFSKDEILDLVRFLELQAQP